MIFPNDFFLPKIFFCKIILICVVNKKEIPKPIVKTDIFEDKNSTDFKSKLRLQIKTTYVLVRKRFKCLKIYFITRHYYNLLENS